MRRNYSHTEASEIIWWDWTEETKVTKCFEKISDFNYPRGRGPNWKIDSKIDFFFFKIFTFQRDNFLGSLLTNITLVFQLYSTQGIHGQALGSKMFIAFLYDNFLAKMRGHLILLHFLAANFPPLNLRGPFILLHF